MMDLVIKVDARQIFTLQDISDATIMDFVHRVVSFSYTHGLVTNIKLRPGKATILTKGAGQDFGDLINEYFHVDIRVPLW